VGRVRRREQVARLEAELEDVRPYLALAREIHAEVQRIARDGADTETLAAAVDAIPAQERLDAAREVFRRLDVERQWEILEKVFDDDELRSALESERKAILVRSHWRSAQAFDTRDLDDDATLTLGLFREADVRAAIAQGHRSTTCARRLVLVRGGDGGALRVIEDVFNPAGGYFVTDEYDHDTWDRDRLPAHAIVRAGSITATSAGASFTPVLHIGGRVDFERDGRADEGRLHLGYVMVGGDDVFAKGGM
jgi:hypothetical protein